MLHKGAIPVVVVSHQELWLLKEWIKEDPAIVFAFQRTGEAKFTHICSLVISRIAVVSSDSTYST